MRGSYEIAHLSLNTLTCPLKLTRASQIMFSFKSSVGYLSCLLVPPHPNSFLECGAQINICSSNCCYVTVLESILKAEPPYNKVDEHKGGQWSSLTTAATLSTTSAPQVWLVWRRMLAWGSVRWAQSCQYRKTESGRYSNLKGQAHLTSVKVHTNSFLFSPELYVFDITQNYSNIRPEAISSDRMMGGLDTVVSVVPLERRGND